MLHSSPPRTLEARGSKLPLGRRPLIMGIVNVTPDSFSDGGQFLQPQQASAQVLRLAAEGADILDIGAESTRPYGGMRPVSEEEELRRLKPVLPEAVRTGLPVSVDTIKSRVAAWALSEGATIVNDVWGLQRDADMARVVAAHDAGLIVMHNREAPDPAADVMTEVKTFLARSLELAERAGIPKRRIAIDPGIGFGKTPEQSLTMIARLEELKSFGLPILIGLSRKRFIDFVSPAPPDQRLGGSIAGNVLAVLAGADIVRVHDVAEHVQALRVADAIRGAH